MEYIKGEPYFCKDGKIKNYQYLNKNLKCDILIIGGGINGAIANYYLSKKYDVVLVDKSRFGYGCTPCATALLEYQLDDFACNLKGEMTDNEIVDVYNMGLYSIQKIDNFINENGNNCNYSKRPTLIYSNQLLTSTNIEKEYEFRKKYNFNCKLLDEGNNPFPFKMKKGLYCEDGGCELSPYLFTKQLIEGANNQTKMFENTKKESIEKVKSNLYNAVTNYKDIIKCKKVIFSTGFNWEVLNCDDLCDRFITYTIVTHPIKNFSWYNNALIQDCLDPYHYLRLLPDGRIIFGGEDTIFNKKCIDENKAKQKYKVLLKQLKDLFPKIKNKIKVACEFCGCFGSTPNNLGLIGKTEDENLMYFFSCGANGIINAMYGIELIEDILNKKQNKFEKLFSPTRVVK